MREGFFARAHRALLRHRQVQMTYKVEEREGKWYAIYDEHEFGPFDDEKELFIEMTKNMKLILNAEYGKHVAMEQLGGK